MKPQTGQEHTPQAQQKPKQKYSTLSSLSKAVLLTLIVISAIALYSFKGSDTTLWPFDKVTDHVTEVQKIERISAFNSMAALPLQLVRQEDMSAAITSMNLPAAAKQDLINDVSSPDQEVINEPTKSVKINAPAARESATKIPTGQSAANKPAVEPKAAVAKTARLKLAWITLWDTDAQDGDTVKIDSQGYSRTVVLTKQPITMAIPVPLSGIIKVTGIYDGDRGGITVGLSSGGNQATFPIMSEGQILGLKVVLN